ncbi:MAG: hypothetical protein ACOYOM_15840 [Chloroflexota bacterium]
MAKSVKAVLGSVAVCGVLLLAGCSSGTTVSASSVAASADAGWNPPRPTGVPDEKWATVLEGDPASLPQENLADGYCQALKPEPADVDAKVQEYPGATVAEFNAYYDYVIAYVAPLCADLPTETGAKGVKRLGSVPASDL